MIIISTIIVILALWIWAVVVLKQHWDTMPDWAKVFSVVGLLPVFRFGPVLTLICVYITKDTKKPPVTN